MRPIVPRMEPGSAFPPVNAGGRDPRAVHPDVVHPFHKLVRGEGVEVVDETGHRLLDAAAGVGVMNLGYTVPEIAAAMEDQAKRIPFVHAMRFDSEPAQEVAGELAFLCPSNIRDFFLCSGGSEAVESALKIARQYHVERGEGTRFRFIGRWQSFHGNTIAAQSVGGHVQRRRRQSPLLIDFPHIEAPNCYRCGAMDGHQRCGERSAEHLRMAIERAGPETVAGFIMETVSGATTGAIVPPADYLERIRRICDEYGILLILDEVYAFPGRTGANFAFDHWDVLPDLVTMGKGVAAGFAPIGVVGIGERVIQAFEQGSGHLEHNFTFASHPISCAAAATAVRMMRELDVASLADRAGGWLRSALQPLEDLPVVGEIRGLGLLIGIEFVMDRERKVPFPAERRFVADLVEQCYRHGLIVYPGTGTADGLIGDHILVTPPLVISEADAARIGELLTASVAAMSLEPTAEGRGGDEGSAPS